MEGIIKEEQHKQERLIYQYRADGGIHAVREWLYRERDSINLRWPKETGEELHKLQGAAIHVRRLIAVIDDGPKIKSVEA